MESFLQMARQVAGTVLRPSSSIFLPYLAAAGVLALVVGHRLGHRGWLALAKYVAPRRIWAHRSTAHDFGIFVINALVYSLLLLPSLQWISGSVGTQAWGWMHRSFGPADMSVAPWVAGTGMTVAAVAAADLAFFISHWLQHRVSVLWAFHQVHHSAVVMQPLTVFRRHPVDVVVESVISGTVVGLVYGLAAYVVGAPPSPYLLLGVNVLLFGFLLGGFNLQHSHVWLTFGPLERVFISPAAHQIHHSEAPEHWGKNLGNIFSIWDRVAGTRFDPRGAEQPTFGLGEAENARWRRLWRLYLLPFADAVRFFGNALGWRRTTRS